MGRFAKLTAFFLVGMAVSTCTMTGAAQPPPDLRQLVSQDKIQPRKDELPILPQPRVFDEQTGPTLELVEFRALPIQEAMRLLSQQSGLKIVVSSEASKYNVSLYLKDVPAVVAVREITQSNGLIFRRESDGIIRIFTAKENVRDLTEFRDQQTEVFTLLYPNAVSIATAIRDLYGDRVVELTYGADDTRVINDLQQRFNRFDLLNSRSYGIGVPGGGIGGGIGGGLGGFGGGLGGFGGGIGGFGGGFGGGGFGGGGFGGGQGGYGGGGFGGGGYGGSGTIADVIPTQRNQQPKYEDQQKKIQALTPADRQALEKALTEANTPEQRTAIIDILSRQAPASIYVTVIRQHNQLMVRTSDAVTMTQIRDLVCRLDVPTPVVLLEVKILSIDLKDDFKSVFDFQFTDGSLVAGGFTTGNILPPFADMLDSSTRRFNAINPGPIGNDPGRDLVFQVVSSNFRARLELLETKNRVTEISAPLLMTANNEVSQIFVGVTRPITIGFTPGTTITTGITTATNAQATPITTLQDIGSTLLITPNINADRTVTLRIHEEKSRVIPGGGSIPLPNGNGTGFTDVPVDVVQRQNVTSTVVAKDGLAIAIGGLIEENVSDARQEVPVLGRIPYVGIFFRRQLTKRERTETVIVIRPYVLTTPAESVHASRSLLQVMSIHPSIVNDSLSMLGTFTPQEVLRPTPPRDCWEQIFKVHMITPKDF